MREMTTDGAMVPLFVDLDNSLLSTDLLVESSVQAIKVSPLNVFRIMAWMLGGRAYLKSRLAEATAIDVENLPYRREVVEFLEEEKRRGREIVIATASNIHLARRIAVHVGLSDGVIASDGTSNLKGKIKLEAIKQYCSVRKLSGFAYLGDSASDLHVWRDADEIVVVAPSRRLLASIQELKKPLHIIGRRRSILLPILRVLRPQQWTKNVLVFVPLLAGQELGNLYKVWNAAQACLVFCLVASSVYVINDLFDVKADRRHERKRRRPFASGDLPLLFAPIIVALLAIFAVMLAVMAMPGEAVSLVGAYFVLNLFYSLWLKSKVVVDVVLLSVMYTLRLLTGGIASDIVVSEWLLAFGMFFFTSLAFAKRYSELYSELLKAQEPDVDQNIGGRGYFVSDMAMICSLGPASGLVAMLVIVLYVLSEDVRLLYQNGRMLLLVCPLMLYWIARIWMITGRGELREDPVSFALRDWRSWVIGALVIIVMFMAK